MAASKLDWYDECQPCGRRKWPSRLYCMTCMRRWKNAGYPGGGPPPVHNPASGTEDLAEIWRPGMTAGQAAARLGRSVRTIERYKKRLREQGVRLEYASYSRYDEV